MSPASKDEALAARPVVNEAVRVIAAVGEGPVRLEYPLVLPRWLGRLLPAGRIARLRRTLELDAMGTFVWNHIDGQRSVRQLAELVAERYRCLPREAEESVAIFIRELGRRNILGLW